MPGSARGKGEGKARQGLEHGSLGCDAELRGAQDDLLEPLHFLSSKKKILYAKETEAVPSQKPGHDSR